MANSWDILYKTHNRLLAEVAELQEQVKRLQAFNKFLSDYHHDCKLAATFNDNNPEAEEVLRAVEHIKSEWDRLAEGEHNAMPTL